MLRILRVFLIFCLFFLPLAGLWSFAAKNTVLPHTLTVLDRHGVYWGTVQPLAQGRQIWTPLTAMPASVIAGFLREEDRYFFYHPGLNPVALCKALWDGVQSGKLRRGGSTVTQQLAKILIQQKEQRLLPRTLGNKWRETLLALGLELRHSKAWILEQYLNSVYLGHRSYGVAASARTYFGKTLAELSPDEVRWLSEQPKAPSRSPAKPTHESLWAQAAGRHLLTELARRHDRGGQLRSTLDLELQTRLESKLKTLLAERIQADPDLNAAVVVLDVATGDVLALVGSRDFDETRISGQFNAALALRQPGSTLKPFTYFAAFAKGYDADSLLHDGPQSFAAAQAEAGYAPRNFDRRFRGTVSVREALANSYNVPAVSVLNEIGLSYYHEILKKFGFTTLTQSPEHYGLAVTLGAGEVNLLELTNAYAVLARGGYFKPYRLTSEAASPAPEAVVPQASEFAARINDILSDPEARRKTFGYDEALFLDDHHVAVKTGTSYELRDNWTVGYTPDLAVGVWVGHSDGTSLRVTTGATGAAPIWHAVMEDTLRGRSAKAFVWPSAPTRPSPQARRLRQAYKNQTEDWTLIEPLAGHEYRLHPYLSAEHQRIAATVRMNTERPQELSWFLDGAPLDAAQLEADRNSRRAWILPVPGRHELRVVARDGKNATVRFQVTHATAESQ